MTERTTYTLTQIDEMFGPLSLAHEDLAMVIAGRHLLSSHESPTFQRLLDEAIGARREEILAEIEAALREQVDDLHHAAVAAVAAFVALKPGGD